jgi:hypothetical protein
MRNVAVSPAFYSLRKEIDMRNTLLALAPIVALATLAPTPSHAQFAVDTPVGGVRIGEPRYNDYWRHDRGWHHGWRDRDVRLRGDCRTVTIERDGYVKRIRRCD